MSERVYMVGDEHVDWCPWCGALPEFERCTASGGRVALRCPHMEAGGPTLPDAVSEWNRVSAIASFEVFAANHNEMRRRCAEAEKRAEDERRRLAAVKACEMRYEVADCAWDGEDEWPVYARRCSVRGTPMPYGAEEGSRDRCPKCGREITAWEG